MNTETKTPRTDAELFLCRGMGIVPTLPKQSVPANLARTLERELAAVTKERDEWKAKFIETADVMASTPCSQYKYIPFIEIPPEVHAAAETMFIFFEKAGMREWQFSYVADRRLVVDLERQVEDLRAQISSANTKDQERNVKGGSNE